MKRLFVLASAVFIALGSVAQDEDTDEYYFFDSDSVVGDLATYSEKTMDVAFEAPSTIISTPGVWYSFSFVTKYDKNMMRVDKWKCQFKAGGTASYIRSSSMAVNYQNIKNIDIQVVLPISWQKTRDVFTLSIHADKASVKCTNQSQLNKMSAREKYDWDEKLTLVQNLWKRSYGSLGGTKKLVRLDKDIVIWQSGNTTGGMVSQAGLNKLIKARSDYKKRQEEEKARQEAEIKARLESEGVKKTYTVNGVEFTMVAVEGGTFMMGGGKRGCEQPIHRVILSSYVIGQTEVTQELWEAVMGNNPSKFKGTKLPVECVSWNDCQTFIQKLNQLTGQQFRLPTEAEWEYAARGGKYSKGYQYSGSDNIEEVAWYKTNSDRKTHEVATKASNELGLYDMSGNLYEWCQDWYDYYYYSSSPINNPTGPASGDRRIIRGGCWLYEDCYVTLRSDSGGDSFSDIGFRLAQ